ncbi:response regulator transcription factor [Undibacterium arcticum]
MVGRGDNGRRRGDGAAQRMLRLEKNSFVQEWEAICPRDDLRESVVGHPGVTALKSGHSPDRDLRRFDARHGLHSALSTVVNDKTGTLVQFISLFRPESAPPFSQRERDLKELIMPHLMQAWNTSWREAPADSGQPSALLAADGRLICADDHFLSTMYAAWPNWNGKQIALTPSQGAGFSGPHAATAKIAIDPVRGSAPGTVRVSISAGPRGALSNRERAVAERYATGLSYKEIAKTLNLSPATVRSYVKSCYEKLSVSNKSQLLMTLRPGQTSR